MSNSEEGPQKGSGTEPCALADAATRQLEEAELLWVREQVARASALREVIAAGGEEPEAYVRRRLARHAHLAARVREHPPLPMLGHRPGDLADALNHIADLFGLWQVLSVPTMTEGVSVAPPGPPDTSGEILTGALWEGGVAYACDLWNSDRQPMVDKWWVHNWVLTVPLPPPPADIPTPGWVAYRFSITARANIYRASVVSGTFKAFATVATTDDLNDRPIDFANYNTSDYVLDLSLPPNGGGLGGRTIHLSGIIPVREGKVAALGLVLGVIVGMTPGEVLILANESFLATHRTVELDAPFQTDFGRIEYRFEPDYWIDAVASMLGMRR